MWNHEARAEKNSLEQAVAVKKEKANSIYS